MTQTIRASAYVPPPLSGSDIYTDHFSKRGLPQDIDLFAKNQILESWYLFEVARLILINFFYFPRRSSC